eukprot:5992522-Pyramimonas_sp.AAC.1
MHELKSRVAVSGPRQEPGPVPKLLQDGTAGWNPKRVIRSMPSKYHSTDASCLMWPTRMVSPSPRSP